MMTGYHSESTLQETLDVQAYEYLQKPISSELLIQVAKRAKERKELLDEKKRIAAEQRYNSFEQVVKQYIDSRDVDTVLEDQMQLLRSDMDNQLSRIQKTLKRAVSYIRESGG
jgi:DNA-binding NtrC family response regulator